MSNAFRYTPTVDILVLVIGLILVFLMAITFNYKNKSYHIFRSCTGLVILASFLNVVYFSWIGSDIKPPTAVIYIIHIAYYSVLTIIMALYNYYLADLVAIPGKLMKRMAWVIWGAWDVGVVLISYSVIKSPMPVLLTDGWYKLSEHNPFYILYVIGILSMMGLLLYSRDKMIKQVFWGIFAAYMMSFLLMSIQEYHLQRSFTTASLMLPVLVMMYLLHSTPYDRMTGAVNEESFEHMVRENYKNKNGIVLMFLNLRDKRGVVQVSEEMSTDFYRMFPGLVKNDVLFRLNNGRYVEVFPKKQNPDFEKTVDDMIAAFDILVEKFHRDFKVVITEDVDFISATNSYVAFVDEVEQRIPFNAYYKVTKKDIELFQKRQYILAELRDIEQNSDLEDERVEVFCQPVLNVETGTYDTAEALMRLTLPLTGMVYPNQFIPLAEEEGLLHPLSRIILNKTCKAVKQYLQEGCALTRVSVNFSIPEVRDENFCSDILAIIEENGLSCDRIAIELTESQNELDFELVKTRIDELKDKGIKFYLDDFGTGYSNMERIMELPFDIIKFDRSMVAESRRNEDSQFMVGAFAKLFDRLDYRVLYEGVEDDPDEEMCMKMNARYLQGYKYSKPVPISELPKFLKKS